MADIQPVNPPVEKTITRTIYGFRIMNVTVVPFEYAMIATNLLDAVGDLIINKTMLLAGLDYEKWNNDDQYLYDWVGSQIQLMSD